MSPHFTLGQFLCKQEGSFPKYLVLREQLVLKLELLLEQFNQAGFRADSFGFVSAYRTPWYNARIENVPYSRHTWGDAADIFLDGDGDGRMDDLDGDGLSGAGDAAFFRDFVETLSTQAWFRPFEGGLGDYKPNAAHGPFVHVDPGRRRCAGSLESLFRAGGRVESGGAGCRDPGGDPPRCGFAVAGRVLDRGDRRQGRVQHPQGGGGLPGRERAAADRVCRRRREPAALAPGAARATP